MKVRCVNLAFVSAAFLAAIAMNGSSALATSPSSQLKLTQAAYQALQSGDADSAIAGYTKAMAAKSVEPEIRANALLNRALAYQQKAMHEAAIADYSTALALDVMAPKLRATALYNRGLSQQLSGSIELAIGDFTNALLLDPEFAHAYYSRGNALRISGQLLFALSDYDRALRFKHPDTGKVHYAIAMSYMALRRPIDARRELDAVLAQDPGHAGALAQMEKLGAAGENQTVAETEVDPILTGSVAVISANASTGTSQLPAAVDVPGDMQATSIPVPVRKGKKRVVDRLPSLEPASYDPADQAAVLESAPAVETEANEIVKVDDVPAIPAPEEADMNSPEPAAEPLANAPASPEEADETAAAEVPASGWMVQVASAVSENAAWSTWNKMQKRSKLLRSLKPVVVRADLGSKGIFYRVRLKGFEGQDDAKAACNKLQAGGVSCYVSKG